MPKHDYFKTISSFKLFSVPLSSYFILKWCSFTTRGVHPPRFQGPLISFYLGALDLFLEQETQKKGQHDCNEKEKIPLSLMAGKTLIYFLRAGLSKCCWLGRHLTYLPSNWNPKYKYFFIKKKKIVVIYSNIHDKFPSKNLTSNLKKIKM